MPRKPAHKKQKITLLVNGTPINVTLTPPTGGRVSWYAYWSGLVASKSTGQSEFEDAVKVAENMLRNNGKQNTLENSLLSDDEFIEIQRRHYGKSTDSAAKKRSEKSLRECLDAISAFRQISGVTPVVRATADDCERFQRMALEQPKNWRVQYVDNSRSKRRREKLGDVEQLSPNTVLKWSVALQAAFERANRNAGKKCVRGVVPVSKLLTENPWRHFTWIKGSDKKLRQFDHSELISLLDYFETEWPEFTIAPAFVKVSLWSWARRLEVSSLRWSDERRVSNECHFESTGKWGVTKWFRIPERLRAELEALRTNSEFVFGGFPQRLHDFHIQHDDTTAARRVRSDFIPDNVGDWMYHQIKNWSESMPNGAAYLHVFRKTTLQYALSAEHIENSVAADASVSKAVMMTSYAQVTDEDLRQKSNRTYQRIRSSLSSEVASRYGWETRPTDQIIERLDQARLREDWASMASLAEELARTSSQAG